MAGLVERSVPGKLRQRFKHTPLLSDEVMEASYYALCVILVLAFCILNRCVISFQGILKCVL